jgi:phosphotransferase system HPr-like phosphotransfer protein
MEFRTILLKDAENVKKFVNVATKYPFDVDILQSRYVVDGKSILGMFSLDLRAPMQLQAFAEDADEFLREIAEFIIEPPEDK